MGDRPEELMDGTEWVELFKASGFFAIPFDLNLPTPLVIYRGATEERARRMAWSTDINVALYHKQRNRNFKESGRLYRAVIDPAGALAYFHTTKRELEVVVDPGYLGEPDEIG